MSQEKNELELNELDATKRSQDAENSVEGSPAVTDAENSDAAESQNSATTATAAETGGDGSGKSIPVDYPQPCLIDDLVDSEFDVDGLKQALNNISHACNLNREIATARILEFGGYHLEDAKYLARFAGTRITVDVDAGFMNQVKMKYAELQEKTRVDRQTITQKKKADRARLQSAESESAANTADKSES